MGGSGRAHFPPSISHHHHHHHLKNHHPSPIPYTLPTRIPIHPRIDAILPSTRSTRPPQLTQILPHHDNADHPQVRRGTGSACSRGGGRRGQGGKDVARRIPKGIPWLTPFCGLAGTVPLGSRRFHHRHDFRPDAWVAVVSNPGCAPSWRRDGPPSRVGRACSIRTSRLFHLFLPVTVVTPCLIRVHTATPSHRHTVTPPHRHTASRLPPAARRPPRSPPSPAGPLPRPRPRSSGPRWPLPRPRPCSWPAVPRRRTPT